MTQVIGIDLGGTKIELGRIDQAGTLQDHLRLPTAASGGPQAVEDQIVTAVQAMQQGEHPPEAVGIGVAGQIEAVSGLIRFAPNLPGWRNVPLQEHLQTRLGIPVRIVNDLRAITWGEWRFGAGQGESDLICLFIGTGIGAGIVSAGKLLQGASNTCGEVGHMTVDLNGPFCTCGNRGCLEALAGGWAIAHRAQEAVMGRQRSESRMLELVNDQRQAITAHVVIDAYRQGDYLAEAVLEQAKQGLLAGCIALVNAFNPRCLILGGGILQGMPEWIEWLSTQLRRWALKAATADLKILPAALGAEAGIMGAAALALKSLEVEEE